MSPLRLAPLAAVIALAAAGGACGKGKGSSSTTSPTAPSPTTPSPGTACRTYPTSANVRTTTTGSSIVFDAIEAATFDPASRTATVRTNFANGAPCSTLVSSYNSVADFVDEVRVIPPIFRTTSSVNTNSGACGTTVVMQTFTYDSQRRLTQMANSVGGVTTYTAWDSSGRPTTGTTGGIAISIVYNDSARSWTQTQTAANGTRTTTTATFDANGAQVSSVVVQGNVTTTTTFTNTATATVCG